MIKRILTKWYLIPVLIYLIGFLYNSGITHYINPIELREKYGNWRLKSESYQLAISCRYMGGENKPYQYNVKSKPLGGLNEEWVSLTELNYAQPVGMVYGNFDFDPEKELLIVSCEGALKKSAIPELKNNINHYLYKGISYMGYYDLQGKSFKFRSITDSPFFSYIDENYISNNMFPENWLFYLMLLFTGVLFLLNWIICLLLKCFQRKR